MGNKKPYVPPRLTEYDPKNMSDTLNPSTARLLICDVPRSLGKAIGIDLTLSKSDGISKLPTIYTHC
jgi:hypothetical protein